MEFLKPDLFQYEEELCFYFWKGLDFFNWTLEQVFCDFSVKEEEFGGRSNTHVICLLFDGGILSRVSQEPSKSCAEFGPVFCLCASASLVCQHVLKFLGANSSPTWTNLQQQSYSRDRLGLLPTTCQLYHVESETLTKCWFDAVI